MMGQMEPRRRPWRCDWPRLALVVWALLATLAIGRGALHYQPRHQGCYAVFADGGRHWLHGEDLYDSEHPESLDVFRYSPLTAAALVPLALVPDTVGNMLFRGAGVAVFLCGLLWWARAGWPDGTPDQRAIFSLLVALMGTVAVMDVQLNLLTIGFLLLGMAAAARGRWNTAALAISLAVCLKAYPIALALVLAVAYPRRFAGRWLLMMGLCLAMPFVLQRPGYVGQQYADWIHYGLNARRPDAGPGIFQDLMLWCRVWLAPISSAQYFWLEVGSGAAIALICVLRRSSGPESLQRIFAMCCAWMMAFGPATEAVTYVQLGPAVAGTVLSAWCVRTRAWYRVAVTFCLVTLVLAQLQLLLPLNKPLHRIAAQPFAALVLLLAAACCHLSRGHRSVSEATPPDREATELRAA